MAVHVPESREDLVATMRDIVVDYYHLDNGPFFDYFSDDGIWVMPNHMVCRGKDEMRAQFASGWVMPSFDTYDAQFELVDTVPGDAAVVAGGYHLLSDPSAEHIMAMSQRLTSVWRPTEAGWRIAYLHVSAEWVETAPGEVYPVESSRHTWRYAQAMIARNLRSSGGPLMLKGANGALVSVDLATLLYVRADGKRCTLHFEDGELDAGLSITELAGKLPEEFVRVHRSYLVNRFLVKSIAGSHIEMVDGALVPIPAKRRVQIKRLFEEASGR